MLVFEESLAFSRAQAPCLLSISRYQAVLKSAPYTDQNIRLPVSHRIVKPKRMSAWGSHDGRKRVHFQFPAACSIDWCSEAGIIAVWEPLPPGSYQGQPIIKQRRWAELRKCQQLCNLQLILSVLKNHVSPQSYSPHRGKYKSLWKPRIKDKLV